MKEQQLENVYEYVNQTKLNRNRSNTI